MPEPRLAAGFWVQAYLARLRLQDIPAFVTSHGDDTAGAVLVKLNTLDGRARAFTRSFDLTTGDRTWVLGWPIWPWWMAASALMIAAAIVQVLVTISDIATLILGGPDEAEPSEPTGGDAIL